MASGRIDGTAQADDVNFSPAARALVRPGARAHLYRPEPERALRSAVPSPLATTKRYPTRGGHDQIFGYGRVNMNRAVDALVRAGDAACRPRSRSRRPTGTIRSIPARRPRPPRWRSTRAAALHLPGLRRPGPHPNNELDTPRRRAISSACPRRVRRRRDRARSRAPSPSSTCGSSKRCSPPAGELRRPRARHGPRPRTVARTPSLTASSSRSSPPRAGATEVQGEDRRKIYLHRDQDMLAGFPRDLGGAQATVSRRRPSSTWTATIATSWWRRPPTARPRLPPRRHRARRLAGEGGPAAAPHTPRPPSSRAP